MLTFRRAGYPGDGCLASVATIHAMESISSPARRRPEQPFSVSPVIGSTESDGPFSTVQSLQQRQARSPAVSQQAVE